MAKSIGLRTEVLLTLAFLLGAALLLGGVFMLRVMEKNLLEQRLEQLEFISQLVVQNVGDSRQDGLPEALSALVKQSENLAWWWFDAELALQERSGLDENIPAPDPTRLLQVKTTGVPRQSIYFPSMLTTFFTDREFARFVMPLRSHGRQSGVLVLHYPLNDIRQKLMGLQKLVLVYVVLYGLVLIAAGYYLLERNIIRPVRGLFDATHKIRSGDLGVRVPVTGPSEISSLAVSYNQMVEALAKSRLESEQHIRSLKDINRELQKTRDELIHSEKMASVGTLAAGLAHELGNPLAALIGYLELLKQRILDPADSDLLQRSLTEAERIDFLVRELLDFSRPADRMGAQQVDIRDELAHCWQLLTNQGVFSDVSVVEDCHDVPPVLCHREKIRQVFINLLLNAVQACTEHGVITLKTGRTRHAVWAEIQDSGCGMTEPVLKKIFDPFFTTKAPGQGTGLGLSICQRIVSEEGGALSVRSVPEQGSVFRVELPLA